MEEKVMVHIFIRGRVQGVFFRENIRQRAGILGIKGWVRNLFDGRVEAIFEGERKEIEKMIGWVRKGPRFAIVKNVEVKWEKYKGKFDSFEVRYG